MELTIWEITIVTIMIALIWATYRYVRGTFRIREEMMRVQLRREFQMLETERSRIATDLHDDLGALLSAVNVRMNCIRNNSENDQEHIHKMRTYLDQAIERLGRISFNLTPQVLRHSGLDAALNEFFYYYQGLDSVQLDYEYRVKSKISPEVALHLYRIVQEIVNNGLKHANASRLQVCLFEKEGSIHLLYSDDGKGFLKDPLDTSEGIGLNSLKNRTDVLNGKMELRTRAGEGVEYYFRIPL